MEVAPVHIHEESMHAPSSSIIETQANLEVVSQDNNQPDLVSLDIEQHVCGPECTIHSRQEAIDEANGALDAILMNEAESPGLAKEIDEIKIIDEIVHGSVEIEGHVCGPECTIHSRQEAIDEANAALDAILFDNVDSRDEPVVVNNQEVVTAQTEGSNLAPTTLLDYDQAALQQDIQRRFQEEENTQQFEIELPKVTSDTLEKIVETETIDEKVQEVTSSAKLQSSSVVQEPETGAVYKTRKTPTREEEELAIDASVFSQLIPDRQIFIETTDEYTKGLSKKDLPIVHFEDETETQPVSQQDSNGRFYEYKEGYESILDNEESDGFNVKTQGEEQLEGANNTVLDLELHNEFMAYIDASFVVENDNGSLGDGNDTVGIRQDGSVKKHNYLLEIKEALIGIESEDIIDLTHVDDEWIQECKEVLGAYEEFAGDELQDFVFSSLQVLGYEQKLLTSLKNEIAKLPPAKQELILLQILLKTLKIKQDAGDRKTTHSVSGVYQDEGSANIENLAVAISRLLFFGFSIKAVVKFC
jgi:hypothetical protein